MWLSRHLSDMKSDDSAGVGPVTIGGEYVGVLDGGEKRGVSTFSPGGYFWKPAAGDDLLIIKSRDGEACSVGREVTDYPDDLLTGEILIQSGGGASVLLKNDGSIRMIGSLSVGGDMEIDGKLTVSGGAFVSGGLTIGGGATVVGNVDIEGGLSVNGTSIA